MNKGCVALFIIHLSFYSPFVFAFDHQHSQWTNLLTRYVHVNGPSSRVDYRAIRQEGLAALDKYLDELSAIRKAEYAAWQQAEKMAFLINAYNAFTVKLILNHYPVQSIKDIGGFFNSPWKQEFFNLFGEASWLDHIEHEMLRKDFAEPRIHFAINCASIGCPTLRNEAYVGIKLEQQLQEQTRTFLTDRSRNRIENNQLAISKIFDWFAEDFEKHSGSVNAFIADFISDDPSLQKKTMINMYDITYLDYDWRLNDKRMKK